MQTLEERFWLKVTKTDACWLWTAAQDGKGYGVFNIGHHRTSRAHRVSWVLRHGPIADEACVLHTCDVPTCVNPDHLFLGTRADNMADCHRKGRVQQGARHYMTKLTEADVHAIRAAVGSCAEIGRRFGISPSSVCMIQNGRRWGGLHRLAVSL